TMEESQEVLGWHHHNFDGNVESVAVIPGTNEDEVWIAIERTINGSVVRYIEQLQPTDWGSNQDSMFFVDSGLSFDGGANQVITGITKASPAVVSVSQHGYTDGEQVRIIGMIYNLVTNTEAAQLLAYDVAGNSNDIIDTLEVLAIADDYTANLVSLHFNTIGTAMWASAISIAGLPDSLGALDMPETSNNVYTVSTVVDVGSFQLRDSTDTVNIDSTGFTAYISGATIEQVENTFATLGHLEGETLSILGDGGYYGQETVSSSTITLDDYYNRVHAGLPYTAKVKPMKLELSNQPGTLFGVTQRITEVLLRLDSTLDCEVGADFTTMDAYAFREID
ncbi:hypothetical protein LCGC14_3147790, partial [marine sediment metagenome]